jgi:predicted MPP superfamily phosphohydrolase
MLNWRMFLSFLSVVLLIMGSVHGYLYLRLVVATGIPDPWAPLLGGMLVLAVLSIPSSFLASRRLHRRVARFLVIPVYVWMGFIFQTFFLVLALDLFRVAGGLLLTVFGLIPFSSPHQALVAWRMAAAVGAGVPLVATVVAIWWGLSKMATRRVEVVLPDLPPELDGFTILHLSDLHLDLVHGRTWLEKVVAKANDLKPNLVAITGDLAEGTVAQYSEDANPIRDLSAPHGVYFVTGNHEYFHDLGGWLAYLKEAGIRVLRNESVVVRQGGGSFRLAGVDDHDGSRMAPGHGPDLRKALADHRPGEALVLLAHQPRIIREFSPEGGGLILSGHTHGGQIWPFSYLVYLQQPHVRGLIQEGNTQLYISSGTGFWGPPMRLGTTAEMALITLRSPGVPQTQS